MRQNILPPQFNEIANLVTNVQYKRNGEWCSTCPQCKDTGHDPRSGISDRFYMFEVSVYGKPLGKCRRCGYVWVPGKGQKPSTEELEAWHKEQIRVLEARKKAHEEALELLNRERVWERFFAANNDYSRGLYHERGFSDEWIKYFQFGLNPDYTVKYKEDEWMEYHSPALSVPIWGADSVVQNVKLRVTCPRNPNHRYRNLYEAGMTYLYQPIHDIALGDGVIVCEGEFKAARMAQELDKLGEIFSLRPVGIQSKQPSPLVYEAIRSASIVYLWLDPDAFEKDSKQGETAVEYNVRILGKERVRIIRSPAKSDDIINAGMNPMNYIRMARRA